jgi:hypothetical protein
VGPIRTTGNRLHGIYCLVSGTRDTAFPASTHKHLAHHDAKPSEESVSKKENH